MPSAGHLRCPRCGYSISVPVPSLGAERSLLRFVCCDRISAQIPGEAPARDLSRGARAGPARCHPADGGGGRACFKARRGGGHVRVLISLHITLASFGCNALARYPGKENRRVQKNIYFKKSKGSSCQPGIIKALCRAVRLRQWSLKCQCPGRDSGQRGCTGALRQRGRVGGYREGEWTFAFLLHSCGTRFLKSIAGARS